MGRTAAARPGTGRWLGRAVGWDGPLPHALGRAAGWDGPLDGTDRCRTPWDGTGRWLGRAVGWDGPLPHALGRATGWDGPLPYGLGRAYHEELEGSFNSKLVNSFLRKNGLLPRLPPEQRTRTPHKMLSPKTPAQPLPHRPQGARTPVPVPPPGETPELRGYRSRGEQDYEFVDRDDYEDGLETGPPNKFGKQLGNLGKTYTDEMKYSGENDNFDYKLVIFNDFCDRADVPEAAKAKACCEAWHSNISMLI
jgi:hypothetical protein